MLGEILETPDIAPDDDFFELGGDSITALRFINMIQQKMGVTCHTTALYDAPSIAKLGEYFEKNYADKVHLLYGEGDSAGATGVTAGEEQPRISANEIEEIDLLTKQVFPAVNNRLAPEKNRRAVFVLSPPRSGSTLLRVMLAGNPALFSPQELNLLCFNSLGEKRNFGGERLRSFFDDGVIDAITHLKNCSSDEAKAEHEEYVAQDMSTQETFGLLQKWANDRIVVEKSPINSSHEKCIERAEEMFDKPLFIHLSRHPHGMIQSYVNDRSDLLFPFDVSLTPRQIGEANWLISHKNIANGLKNVPLNRQIHIRYEDMVREPEAVMRKICNLINIQYDAEMINPYGDSDVRMTGALSTDGEIIGDRKFRTHKGIDASAADRWRAKFSGDFLCEESWNMARQLGYVKDV